MKREEREVLEDKKRTEGKDDPEIAKEIAAYKAFMRNLKEEEKEKEKAKKQAQSDSKQRFKEGIEMLRGIKNNGKSKRKTT